MQHKNEPVYDDADVDSTVVRYDFTFFLLTLLQILIRFNREMILKIKIHMITVDICKTSVICKISENPKKLTIQYGRNRHHGRRLDKMCGL